MKEVLLGGKSRPVVIAICSLLGACALDEEELGVDDSEVLTNNALANNALANNALTNNALTNNALTNNALANNGLVSIAAVRDTLCSTDSTVRTNSRAFYAYMTGCALPTGTSIAVQCTNGQPNATFTGSLGLAPNWRTMAPTIADKEWVSSCIAARVNTMGNIIALSMRGSIPALATTSTEATAYPYAEGSFYGNLFTTTPSVYACGITHAGTQVGRGCAWGSCPPIVGRSSCGAGTCTGLTNGINTSCTDSAGVSWTRPITIYLKDYNPLPSG